MGLFALAIPAILLSGRPRRYTQSNDVEKAVRQDSRSSGDNDLAELEHVEPTNDRDVLTTNTPHRGIRRVYSNATRTFSDSTSDDLFPSKPSLWARFKEYIWPSKSQATEMDGSVPNYRWTPILSGIIIPFSILLQIPGITEHWYIRTENNNTVETQPNTPILQAGIIISLIFALLANIALLVRFLEKHIKAATLLCIIFLTIHDIINIVTVTVFGVEHRFDDGFTYGQAFWLTLCCTIASSFTNITLIVDLVCTRDFARRGSGLTRRQRALMIIVMVLLLYIAFGALVNSYLLDLSFINGLYFTVVSIETIGFGDIVPKTTGARIWDCFYIAFGILNIGVAIAMCRETILEGLEIGYRRRVRSMRERRRDARRFRRWEARWRRAVEFRLRESGQPIWVPDEGDESKLHVTDVIPGVKIPFFKRMGTKIKRTATRNSVSSVFTRQPPRRLNIDALTNVQLEEAALEAGVPLEMFCDLGCRKNECEHGHHALDVHGLPVRQPSVGKELISAVMPKHAAHVFHEAISSGWPANPPTPTHAQLGRMAAMITKFAVAVSGNHVHPPRHTHEEHLDDQTLDDAHMPQRSASDPSGITGGTRYPRSITRRSSYTEIKKHPAAKWLKDFSRDAALQQSGVTYEVLKTEMENEEKRAYYAKLTVAWLLFITFWTVGSGIFCATEGWGYGTAIYFCFVAFSTTGYGDLTPQTPAGRAVFVVWALFGVATLTILVSVLQEAGSSRYKSVLHSHLFDKAVTKYRKNMKEAQDERLQRPFLTKDKTGSTEKSFGKGITGDQRPSWHRDTKPTPKRVQESNETAQRALEALPGEIMRIARVFRECMQFFVSTLTLGAEEGECEGDSGKPKIPHDMKKLLDELAEIEGIGKRVKAEILQDDDAKKTLFMLSLERSLKDLVTSAEMALLALTERDALATMAAAHEPSSRHVTLRRPATFDLPEEVSEQHPHIRAKSEPSLAVIGPVPGFAEKAVPPVAFHVGSDPSSTSLPSSSGI